ncbi:MAG TPA: hypothetical protein VFE24_18130 [Pirellulales bacterium]|nr:hypothetical protein [Pirellulales bacterium]
MQHNRSKTARFIAGAIALGGVPFAIVLVGLSLECGFPSGLLVYLLFLPGWFAFFVLIWAALNRKLPGDPFTTWIPCFLVNGFWLFNLGIDNLVSAYAATAVIASAIGLLIEMQARQPCDARN